MIRVLVADDDPNKLENVLRVVKSVKADVNVEVGSSRAEVLRMLQSRRYDLLILDLVMPLDQGGEPKENVGRGILDMMSAGVVRAAQHVLVMTGYEDAASRFDSEFSSAGWRAVKYDSAEEDWGLAIREKLGHIERCGAGGGYGFDVAILCALEHPELAAVRELDFHWQEFVEANDDSLYLRGAIDVAGRQLSVIAASCSQMGMATAAAMTAKVVEKYRPKVLAMCGIAAGRQGAFGDVLVASDSWDAGAGKLVGPNKLQVEPTQAHGDSWGCPALVDTGCQVVA